MMTDYEKKIEVGAVNACALLRITIYDFLSDHSLYFSTHLLAHAGTLGDVQASGQLRNSLKMLNGHVVCIGPHGFYKSLL